MAIIKVALVLAIAVFSCYAFPQRTIGSDNQGQHLHASGNYGDQTQFPHGHHADVKPRLPGNSFEYLMGAPSTNEQDENSDGEDSDDTTVTPDIDEHASSTQAYQLNNKFNGQDPNANAANQGQENGQGVNSQGSQYGSGGNNLNPQNRPGDNQNGPRGYQDPQNGPGGYNQGHQNGQGQRPYNQGGYNNGPYGQNGYNNGAQNIPRPNQYPDSQGQGFNNGQGYNHGGYSHQGGYDNGHYNGPGSYIQRPPGPPAYGPFNQGPGPNIPIPFNGQADLNVGGYRGSFGIGPGYGQNPNSYNENGYTGSSRPRNGYAQHQEGYDQNQMGYGQNFQGRRRPTSFAKGGRTFSKGGNVGQNDDYSQQQNQHFEQVNQGNRQYNVETTTSIASKLHDVELLPEGKR